MDRLTDVQIAAEVGIGLRTLKRWKTQEDFNLLVKRHVEALRKAVLQEGIADRVKRVAALDDRWKRMLRVIEERAMDPKMEEVPGGQTGLITRQVKGIGKGEDFQVIDIYAVDAGLLTELRNHEKQAAQELGQWTEKTALTDPSGEREYAGLSDTDRANRIAAILRRARARGTRPAAGSDPADAD